MRRQIIPNYVLVVATGLLMALTTGASPVAITSHTDFEGGNLGKVERIGEAHFRCTIDGECDQDGRNRQTSWFYFRMDGAAGEEITLDFGTLPGEYNNQPNRGGFDDAVPPVISYDQKTWTHLSKAEYDEATNLLTVRFRVKHSPVWIARIAPYTNRDLARLMEEITRSPFLKRTVIGRSVESRPIWFLTITDPAVPDKDKKVLWLMARQHSWESGTSWVNEGALRFLVSSVPNAQWLRRHCVFNDFPLCDPDGVARGGVRFNRYGYDLNRNWDTADPKNMPEIAALRKTVLDWVFGPAGGSVPGDAQRRKRGSDHGAPGGSRAGLHKTGRPISPDPESQDILPCNGTGGAHEIPVSTRPDVGLPRLVS